jgi:hypothetical protein
VTTYKIYLVDPAGGGVSEPQPGVLVVQHSLLGEVAEVTPIIETVKNPGELRVTQAALSALGVDGVQTAFLEHIGGMWWGGNKDDNQANNDALKSGGVIYNIDRKRGVYLITYQGDNSTLITREEY